MGSNGLSQLSQNSLSWYENRINLLDLIDFNYCLLDIKYHGLDLVPAGYRHTTREKAISLHFTVIELTVIKLTVRELIL